MPRQDIDLSNAPAEDSTAPEGKGPSSLPALSVKDFYNDPAVPRDACAKDTVECLSSLVFSAWNPPPGNRRLRGALECECLSA